MAARFGPRNGEVGAELGAKGVVGPPLAGDGDREVTLFLECVALVVVPEGEVVGQVNERRDSGTDQQEEDDRGDEQPAVAATAFLLRPRRGGDR